MITTLRQSKLQIVVLLSLALIACSSTKPPQSSDTTRISLERGPCFGACPIYKVQITGDGAVTYVGERFVKVTGEQHAQISRDDVAALVDKFVKADFYALKDDYSAQVTDLPTFTLFLSLDGREKTVRDYAGAMASMPEIVSQLEMEVDRVAGTDKWVKGE